MNGVRVPQPVLVLFGNGTSLACDPDGQLNADGPHGFFVGDTRVLSTYQIEINGTRWELLGRSREGHGIARWQFQNRELRDVMGVIDAGTLLFTLRRRLDGALHDDLKIQAFLPRPLHARLTLQLDADFADLFEVKEQSIPPRLDVVRAMRDSGVSLVYERNGFRRALDVAFSGASRAPTFSGTRVVFELDLEPGEGWHCCLDARPEIGHETVSLSADPHEAEPDAVPPEDALVLDAPAILRAPFMRGRADLRALAVPQAGAPPFIAAGAPWFLTLFGRDPLIAALMAGIDGSWMAEGVLHGLSRYQASARDDFRDAEPGKFPHELRSDELTHAHILPYSPYYGTHDAPALFCLTLWHAWRWRGDRRLLAQYLPAARRALDWCEHLGDRDGDGLLEYATRSRHGYRNQGWKDAEDAIVHADGRHAALPIATVELQAYWFAAHLAMAEMLESENDAAQAAKLRAQAQELRQRVEARYWRPDLDYYALALDGDKQPCDSISSNPAHLLWCGVATPDRAAAVAQRLLAGDMFSGFGLRTLSATHPAYNPLSYQRGSVWPHDTALAAAGLWRYGEYEAAGKLLEGVLAAASAFESERLPELFCGIDRTVGVPVPYKMANTPQAWAAAVPLLATQLFLGIVPDAPHGRCYVAPHLPPWLPRIALHGLEVGQGRIDIVAVREDDATRIEKISSHGIDVVPGAAPSSPLWGGLP